MIPGYSYMIASCTYTKFILIPLSLFHNNIYIYWRVVARKVIIVFVIGYDIYALISMSETLTDLR